MELAILATINGAIEQGASFTGSNVLDFTNINNGNIGFADPDDPTKLYTIHRVVQTNTGYHVESQIGDFDITK